MERLIKRVGILATGDEIVNGDILNTNGQYIAQQCFQNNIQPGIQITVSDDQTEMESGIRYLLQDHAVVITLGGLGPTSDDRTRYALSAALERPLIFNQASWDRIVNMLTRLSLPIPDTNRQQCDFPQGAEIIPNDNGTASACFIQHGKQLVFMLPGPPNEFQSIFDKAIMPKLLASDLQQLVYHRSWMLFGVSEGLIAKQLDPLIEGSDCDIGYRVSYPYLEVKLQSLDEAAIESLSQQFDTLLADKLISKTKQRASELFIQYLQENKTTFSIQDKVTGGLLASILTSPKTHSLLFFNENNTDVQVNLEGLRAYWQQKDNEKYDSIHIVIDKGPQLLLDKVLKIPIRGPKTPIYAMEIICLEILNSLKRPDLI